MVAHWIVLHMLIEAGKLHASVLAEILGTYASLMKILDIVVQLFIRFYRARPR